MTQPRPQELDTAVVTSPAFAHQRRQPNAKWVRYTLSALLEGLKPDDMPQALGWDEAKPAGKEAW
jgi:hypothetical protein